MLNCLEEFTNVSCEWQAVTSGSNILMGFRLCFRMEWLQRVITNIPLSGREFMAIQPEIALHLAIAIQTFCAINNLQSLEVRK
jgi:hypothetical protein